VTPLSSPLFAVGNLVGICSRRGFGTLVSKSAIVAFAASRSLSVFLIIAPIVSGFIAIAPLVICFTGKNVVGRGGCIAHTPGGTSRSKFRIFSDNKMYYVSRIYRASIAQSRGFDWYSGIFYGMCVIMIFIS
jgi:hypothetical protein